MKYHGMNGLLLLLFVAGILLLGTGGKWFPFSFMIGIILIGMSGLISVNLLKKS